MEDELIYIKLSTYFWTKYAWDV